MAKKTRRPRKRITWTAGSLTSTPVASGLSNRSRPERTKHKYPYFPDPPSAQAFLDALQPGAFFLLLFDVGVSDTYREHDYEQPEFPYIEHRAFATGAVASAGTMAVYMGTVRVEEELRGKAGKTIRSLRHSFLIAGKRYLARDLHIFQPG